MDTVNLKSVVESLLFVADEPVALDKLCAILEEFGRPMVVAALHELQSDCEREGRGIFLEEVAGGYQLRTRLDNAPYLKRLTKIKPFKFSQSALETLAIIAYRQPIIRAEIEHLRGVDAGGVLKTLLEKQLIKILGKKDIPGKPLIYGTTKEFLEVFNLKELASLPTLKEFQQLAETDKFEQQEELPLAPPAPEEQGL